MYSLMTWQPFQPRAAFPCCFLLVFSVDEQVKQKTDKYTFPREATVYSREDGGGTFYYLNKNSKDYLVWSQSSQPIINADDDEECRSALVGSCSSPFILADAKTVAPLLTRL